MSVFDRLKKYAGLNKDPDRCPSNPCITVREAIEIADTIESLRQQLELMQKAPQWATYARVCEQLAEAKAEIDSLKSKFELLKVDLRCDISCMLSCKMEADYYNKLIAEKDAEIELLRQQLADQKAYYEQVMADGGKRIKDLMDQNESLRKANKECVEYFNEAQKELAARHLREQQLREALDRIGITSLDARQIADDALAIPSDASALDAITTEYQQRLTNALGLLDAESQIEAEVNLREMIARVGRVTRECAADTAEDYNGKQGEHDGSAIAHLIRALPPVKLEDLK